ncbi:phosphate ABC transporter substrate-binding protein PstS [Shewanella yunxiaonensis]|uniref:Phosphate-binding protein PstS n=1 Tax=Shewanella yunxiaonensis TaxID=2829809 RepID=A0ABX7YR69_9GAMM|nr:MULTISPECIES: phosphate ABC transporter substrate-binding protein PstS [Shewanella]MDF0533622.1 phosphate ABC transporter substrate-binding protein PstS [Shewanella sp. A32]QUN04631.1 phosphate ABC transporter substrate-binding protein PstS [Shewanella yunxiaonensis]
MNNLLKGALLGCTIAASASVYADTVINGAGATFPYPVYAKWAEQYNKETGVKLNYQAIGSGGGIKQIIAKTVDFGASDAPLDKAKLDKEGLVQFPAVMGSIVAVVNLPGVKAGELKLSGALLADIYLGKVKSWDDKAIADLNSGVKLPHTPIYTVHRSDGSGTTYNFTDYLARVSSDWKSKVGVDKEVAWPQEAHQLGGKGNAGVANFVKRTKGSIGYVEYAYAKTNNLAYTQMQNQAGKFVQPTMEAFMAAAANADWANAPGFKLILNDQPGAASWPMTAATFILMHKSQANEATAKEVLKFFEWSYANGDELASQLEYVPMPDNVVKMVETMWHSDIKTAGGKAVY